MYELPVNVTIKNKEYRIRNDGDYRMVLDCFNALQDNELSKQERLIVSLAIFYQDVLLLDSLDNDLSVEVFKTFESEENIVEAIQAMYSFFNCNNLNVGNQMPYKLLDWEQDEQMIVSAVNKVATTEIRALPYLHWFTFMGYYQAVGESTLATVVNIRGKLKKGKKLEEYEKNFKKDNPHYFVWDDRSIEDKEAEDYVMSIWNQE